jgi:hypothetical protein
LVQSWCPLPFLCAANKSAYYMKLTQQTTDHRFSCQCSLPHIDLRLPGHIQRRGKGKHMVWRSEHKAALHTCLKTRLSSNLFETLYAIKNINPATNTS